MYLTYAKIETSLFTVQSCNPMQKSKSISYKMLNFKDVLILQFLKFIDQSIYTERTHTLLAYRIKF
jgi:hypothetical protein